MIVSCMTTTFGRDSVASPHGQLTTKAKNIHSNAAAQVLGRPRAPLVIVRLRLTVYH